MNVDPLLLNLQNDLLTNILQHAADIQACSTQTTSRIREMIGARVVALLERRPDGGHRLLAACPERKATLFEDKGVQRLVDIAGCSEQAETIVPGRGDLGTILAELGMQDSFVVPLRVGEESFGMLLLLDLMDTRGIQKILDALRSISGLLSLVFKTSFLYRNLESLVDRRTRALQQSEEKFRTVANHIHNWEYWLNPGGDLVYVSPSCRNITGYDAEEFSQDPGLLLRIVHPDDRESFIQHVKDIGGPAAAQDCKMSDYRILTRNREERWIAHVCREVFDQEGTSLGRRVSNRDITEQKQAEEALRESEERLQLVMEGSQLGYWDWDIVTGEVRRNRQWAEMLGYTLEEIESTVKQWTALHHPDDRAAAWQSIQDHLDGKTPVHRIEYRVLAKDGQYRWILDQARVVKRDAQGKPLRMSGTHTDITEWKLKEEEREKLKDQLAQAQKMESIGRLAGGVAHDFNNKLSVILGYTEMILDQLGPGMPHYSELLEVQKAARHSADITRQLLAFARKQTIAPKVLDLNRTIEGILKMLRRLIGEDIDLSWLPGYDVAQVKIDPSQIDQILANLCVNARDAIEGTGRITIETGTARFDEKYCAYHPGYTPGDYVMLAVGDNGCGMDQETKAQIFEPFFTTKEVDKGTGLGLATVYGIVKQNKGFIDVHSEPNQGTTFKIYFPQHQTKRESPAGDSKGAAAEGGYETILLVEDEPAILRMTKTMLERLGYRVIAAGSPGEAIQLAQEFSGEIHLLVTDVVMPEMNGRDLAGNVLSYHPGLKRLFMSGYTADVIAHHGILDEGVNFIQKPFTKEILGVKVRESLNESKQKTTI